MLETLSREFREGLPMELLYADDLLIAEMKPSFYLCLSLPTPMDYFEKFHGLHTILEDNLSRDFLYQMSNIEYPYVNND